MQYRLLLYLFDDCMNSMDPAKKGLCIEMQMQIQ